MPPLVRKDASATQSGELTTGTQIIAGPKTFTGTLFGTDTTDSSSSTTGAFKTAGGMGIAKALFVGGNFTIGSTAGRNLITHFDYTELKSATAAKASTLYFESAATGNGSVGANGTNAADVWGTSGKANYAFLQGASGVQFIGNATEGGFMTAAGAWTLGASATGMLSTAHSVIGTINSASTGTSDGSKRLYLNANANNAGVTQVARAGGGSLGGVVLQLLARTSDSDVAFLVAANKAADANTGVDATNILQGTQAGAWTLGPAATATTHTVNASVLQTKSASTTGSFKFNMLDSAGTFYGQVGFNATGGTPNFTNGTAGYMAIVMNSGLDFGEASGALIGKVTSAGAWTFGPSAGGAEHVAKGIITAECFVTASGSQSAAHNTATTFYTIPAQGHYIVSVWLNGVATTYGCFANVINSNGSGRIVSNDGGNATITLSGSTLLQVTQLSGSTQTMTWNVTKVGRI